MAVRQDHPHGWLASSRAMPACVSESSAGPRARLTESASNRLVALRIAPGADHGGFLIAISYTPSPPKRIIVRALNLLVLAFVGAGLELELYFTSSMPRAVGPAFAGGPALAWALVMFPLPLLRSRCGRGPLHLLFYSLATALRISALFAEMLIRKEVLGLNRCGLQVVYVLSAGAFLLQTGYSGGCSAKYTEPGWRISGRRREAWARGV